MLANIHFGLLLLTFWTFADTSVSTLDCSAFRSDKEIIQSIPFRILINPAPYDTQLYYSYAVGDTAGNIRELSLIGIADIPLPIFCLKNLQSLTIKYSSNLTISPEIARLSGTLTTLNLTSISRELVLPVELFNIVSLRRLTIDASGLEVLPEQIGKLYNLVQLTLSNNRLRTLPATLKQLSFRSLNVDNNGLLTSLDILNGSPYLWELSAKNCALEHLPMNLTNLQTINMDGNQLTKLDSLNSIIGNPWKSMIFSNNKIASLPIIMNSYVTAEYIDLSNNLLTELPMWLYNIKLKYIDVRQNKFSEKEKEWVQGMFRPSSTTVNI